jgi:hypothetical protein
MSLKYPIQVHHGLRPASGLDKRLFGDTVESLFSPRKGKDRTLSLILLFYFWRLQFSNPVVTTFNTCL